MQVHIYTHTAIHQSNNVQAVAVTLRSCCGLSGRKDSLFTGMEIGEAVPPQET